MSFQHKDAVGTWLSELGEVLETKCYLTVSPQWLFLNAVYFYKTEWKLVKFVMVFLTDPTMRSRPCFTTHQTKQLETEFTTCHYITRRRRIEIAYALNLTEKQIKTWFQNRRVKERKTKKSDDWGCLCAHRLSRGVKGPVKHRSFAANKDLVIRNPCNWRK